MQAIGALQCGIAHTMVNGERWCTEAVLHAYSVRKLLGSGGQPTLPQMSATRWGRKRWQVCSRSVVACNKCEWL